MHFPTLLTSGLVASVGVAAAPIDVTQHLEEELRAIDDIAGYNALDVHASIFVPCPGCFSPESGEAADEDLVFHVVVEPSSDLTESVAYLNNEVLGGVFEPGISYSSRTDIEDRSGRRRNVGLVCHGVAEPPSSALQNRWDLPGSDDSLSLICEVSAPVTKTAFKLIIMRPLSSDREVNVLYHGILDQGLEPYRDAFSSDTSSINDAQEIYHDDDSDLAAEWETLRLLEAQAQQFNYHVAAKKKAIASALKKEEDKLCLKHLIEECDGVLCAAKAVLHRISNKLGLKTEHSATFAQIHKQQTVVLNEKQAMLNETVEHDLEAVHLPLMLTKNGTHDFPGFDLVNTPNPLIRALQIIAAVLGISAVFAFLRRRCMSMRKRVDRRADIEERRNARAYRRAARRALMRKRWDNFRNAFSCFRAEVQQPTSDYEEKRALILQDALFEQDLDQAEKGEVMEAEIRELRYAHEIVSSLVRVDENRFELITPIHDPPPPLVPLPYTPAETRSRANSSYTLPSYTSESLPDYSSRPDDTPSLTDGYTPSTTESQGPMSPVSPASEYPLPLRFTPTSSILEMSPRPSEETLRTRQSRDTARR